MLQPQPDHSLMLRFPISVQRLAPISWLLVLPLSNLPPQIDGKLLWHESVHCRFNGIDPPIRVPSISLPAGVTASGLPVGLQLQGTPGAVPALHSGCRRSC